MRGVGSLEDATLVGNTDASTRSGRISGHGGVDACPGCAGIMIGAGGGRKWMGDEDGWSEWKRAQEEDCQAIGGVGVSRRVLYRRAKKVRWSKGSDTGPW